MRRFRTLSILASALLAAALPAAGQSNILLPVDSLERLLGGAEFQVVAKRDTRFEGDRTQRVDLAFGDGSAVRVKWARSAPSGGTFNNQPRYELAAYQFQKLFLDEPDYVVPPTIARVVPLTRYRAEFDPQADATFHGAASVLVILQYWLSEVSNANVFDQNRLLADTAYERHFANLNLLTHLIRHSDSNTGNVLISTIPDQPRLFSVDNGVAFGFEGSDRGHAWRELRVRRVPRATVDRLRAIKRAQLDRALAVVAQFEVRDGALHAVPVTDRFRDPRGVRRQGSVYQLGLTGNEIGGIEKRIAALLARVDSGRLETF